MFMLYVIQNVVGLGSFLAAIRFNITVGNKIGLLEKFSIFQTMFANIRQKLHLMFIFYFIQNVVCPCNSLTAMRFKMTEGNNTGLSEKCYVLLNTFSNIRQTTSANTRPKLKLMFLFYFFFKCSWSWQLSSNKIWITN